MAVKYKSSDIGDSSLYGEISKGTKYPVEGVKGWNTTRAGLASDLATIGRSDATAFTDPTILSQREPFRLGKFWVWILRYPSFFPKEVRSVARALIERTPTAIGGLPEPTVEKITHEEGSSKDSYMHPGAFTANNGIELTLRIMERVGQPLTKFIDFWNYGIWSPGNRSESYYGMNLRALTIHRSMDLLVAITEPGNRPDGLVRAGLLVNSNVYKFVREHTTAVEVGVPGDIQNIEVPFSGTWVENDSIDTLASMFIFKSNAIYGNQEKEQLPSYVKDIYENINKNTTQDFASLTREAGEQGVQGPYQGGDTIDELSNATADAQQQVKGYTSEANNGVDEKVSVGPTAS